MVHPECSAARSGGKHRTAGGYMNCRACGPNVGKKGPGILVPPPPLSKREGKIPANAPAERALRYFSGMSAEHVAKTLREDEGIPPQAAVALAGSKRTSPAVLELLWDHPRRDVLRAVAGNPNTPEQTMMKMLEASREEASLNIAYNESASKAVLLNVIDGGIRQEIAAVARREDIDKDLTSAIFDSPEFRRDDITKDTVLSGLAMNKSLDKESIDMIVRLFPRITLETRRALAKHKNASEFALNRIADSDDPNVVFIVASNHNAPSDLLGELTKSDDFYTRHAAVTNPSTPPEALAAVPEEDRAYTYARASMKIKAAERFGFDVDNHEATEYLASFDRWWEMEDDDPAIFLARKIFPDREK